MPISVASPVDATRLAPALRALVRRALRNEKRRPGEIAVVLSDDATLRDLNRRYRKIPRTTDVLSFGYDEGPEPGEGSKRRGTSPHRSGADAPKRAPRSRRAPAVNGDIVISLERVVAQARRFRVSRGEELARLVVHGALHLAGLDHHAAAERRHMRAQEERVLRAGRAETRALERTIESPRVRAAFEAMGHPRD